MAMDDSHFDLPGIDDRRLAGTLRRRAIWKALLKRRLWVIVPVTGIAVGAAALVSELFRLGRYATFVSMFVASFLCALVFARWRRKAEGAEMRTSLQSLGARCVACGYDLRGQVGPRCPECGESVGDRTALDSPELEDDVLA